jgi:copper homeostasis protein
LTGGGEIDVPQIGPLIELSHSLGLKATFHRAFDAVRGVPESLELLIQLGIDRILTSGVPWGESGSALDGVLVLNQLIQQCAERTKIVIGGSVSPENAPLILKELQPWKGDLSVHVYSGVMENDKTSERKVRLLVDAVSL